MKALQTSVKKSYSGKWLNMLEIAYKDENNILRTWESVERVDSNGAVVIIPRFVYSGEFLLIRQFRPPVSKYIMEFPAGLIDRDETPSQAALRELKEETGYSGSITSISSPTYSSPGLSSEIIIFTHVLIDESNPENFEPKTNFDEGESIEIFKVKSSELSSFLDFRLKKGDAIDAKLRIFSENPL